MKAIGLDHPMRELAGFHRTTTASDSTWAFGEETAGVSNTITTGIAIGTATSTITNDMVIVMVITATAGRIDS
jgi:hypothetical protein